MAYKEKDTKKWTAQWFETNAKGEKKKRRKRGFETKREALEYERQKKLNNSRSMDMKLSEFMEVYFEDKQNELKERTMKNKRYMMEQHIVPYFGNQMMSEITAGQIIQWQNEMQTKGFSEAYLRMIQNQLTCLYTHASKIYDLHANPCKKVKRMGSSDSRSLDFWTVDEYQKFIQTMEPGTRYYLIFEILFWTGCRIGELLALTPKDIDFDRNQISITKTYYRTGRQDVITEPKTKQSVRVVEIPEFLKKEIKDFVDRHYGMPEDERLFPIVQEAVQHKMKRQTQRQETFPPSHRIPRTAPICRRRHRSLPRSLSAHTPFGTNPSIKTVYQFRRSRETRRLHGSLNWQKHFPLIRIAMRWSCWKNGWQLRGLRRKALTLASVTNWCWS